MADDAKTRTNSCRTNKGVKMAARIPPLQRVGESERDYYVRMIEWASLDERLGSFVMVSLLIVMVVIIGVIII